MTSKENLIEKYRESIIFEDMPEWIDPMLATLTQDYFDDPNWIFERKLDGERCIAYKSKDASLFSRNRKKLNDVYPEIIELLSAQEGQFIVDGEMVAFDGDITSFSKLQKRMHKRDAKKITETGIKVYYYVFDVLHIDGYSTRNLELRHRKTLLKNSLIFEDPLRYTIHRNEKGLEYHKEACKKGWEGVIAKDGNSMYLETRSRKWLKFKCRNQQEFVIGGFTEPEGERVGLGALLVGYYDNDEFVYAGKVGTGYSDELLKTLSEQLRELEINEIPYSDKVDEKNVHWVQPKLVCEVKFTEWTENNKLRHPSFLGLRDDKPPNKVTREAPINE